MGMYTGLRINVALRRDTPSEVINTLQMMVNATMDCATTLTHPLFSCDRWDRVLCCQSAYFPECEAEQPEPESRLVISDRGIFLNTASSLKNYNNEINLFLDWIAPYVREDDLGKVVGWTRYEEFNKSTLITFVGGGKVGLIEPEGPLFDDGR